MPGLLVDINELKKELKNELKNEYSIENIKSGSKIYVVFLMTEQEYAKEDRITYINSTHDHFFVIYNKKKKICEICNIADGYNKKKLEDVVKSLIELDSIIWAGPIPENKVEMYIQVGFNIPYFTEKSPLGRTIEKGLSFIYENNKNKLDILSIKNKLKYILSQKDSIDCVIYARFTKKAIKFLREIINTDTLQGKFKDKELSGSLYVSKVKNMNGKIVFELTGDKQSLSVGSEEEVDAVWSRYNLHTHPQIAYNNHNVTNGWPSSQDFVGFLELNNSTIFHTVVTLEGVYIISLYPELIEDLTKINRKDILKIYHIDHIENITPEQFTERINEKTYKGKKLFVVKYMHWDNMGKAFPAYYQKTDGNCLSTDDSFESVLAVS